MRSGATSPRTGTGPAQDLARLVDQHSPHLLQVAGFFAADGAAAQRMVVRAWHLALPVLLPDPLAGAEGTEPPRVALVRALAVGDPDDPRVDSGARALRLAVQGAGCFVPLQLQPVTAAAGRDDLPARLRAVVGPLRLVLLLTDVQGWAAQDVEELLEVRPAARRALLALARDQLCRDVRPLRAG